MMVPIGIKILEPKIFAQRIVVLTNDANYR